jgi:hypothetical protein
VGCWSLTAASVPARTGAEIREPRRIIVIPYCVTVTTALRGPVTSQRIISSGGAEENPREIWNPAGPGQVLFVRHGQLARGSLLVPWAAE